MLQLEVVVLQGNVGNSLAGGVDLGGNVCGTAFCPKRLIRAKPTFELESRTGEGEWLRGHLSSARGVHRFDRPPVPRGSTFTWCMLKRSGVGQETFMTRLILVLLFLMFLAPTAGAIDGRLEINQACATGPGCFPGDTAGWPVQIQNPGSYILTSSLTNLDVAAAHVSIEASGVTLDLNGFEVRGSAVCTGAPPIICTSTGFGHGIRVDSVSTRRYVIVRNGRVIGAYGGGYAVVVGDRSSVEDLTVEDATGGIFVREFSTVRRVSVFQIEGAGIATQRHSTVTDSMVKFVNDIGIYGCLGSLNDCDCVISRNVVAFNGNTGIVGGHTCQINDNVVRSNSGHGIAAGNDGLVVGNVVSENTALSQQRGLLLGDDTGYRSNIVNDNSQGAIGGNGGGTPVNMGSNFCDGVAC